MLKAANEKNSASSRDDMNMVDSVLDRRMMKWGNMQNGGIVWIVFACTRWSSHAIQRQSHYRWNEFYFCICLHAILRNSLAVQWYTLRWVWCTFSTNRMLLQFPEPGDKMLKGAMFINLSSYNTMYAIWSACAALFADNLAECCSLHQKERHRKRQSDAVHTMHLNRTGRMPRICGGTTDIVFASCHARNLCAF